MYLWRMSLNGKEYLIKAVKLKTALHRLGSNEKMTQGHITFERIKKV